MIFELKRGRRAEGEERDEARAEMIFELKRGRRAEGVALRVEQRSCETRTESIGGEARAEMIFELKRGRRAEGEERGEARAE